MFVRFAPAGGDVQSWDFDPDDVLQSQAEMIEKRYKANWDTFLAAVRSGEAKARRVLLWHLQRLTHHNLRFEDTPDFRMREFTVEFSMSELQQMLDRIARVDRGPLSEETAADLDNAQGRLEQELVDAALRERGDEPDEPDGEDEEPAGKAPSNSPG